MNYFLIQSLSLCPISNREKKSKSSISLKNEESGDFAVYVLLELGLRIGESRKGQKVLRMVSDSLPPNKSEPNPTEGMSSPKT